MIRAEQDATIQKPSDDGVHAYELPFGFSVINKDRARTTNDVGHRPCVIFLHSRLVRSWNSRGVNGHTASIEELADPHMRGPPSITAEHYYHHTYEQA